VDRTFVENPGWKKLNSKVIFKFPWIVYLALTGYWIVRLWGHFPATMDTLEYVFPEKWFNVESFQRGRIPLWNPYIAGGTPHVANLQSAAFYPFFWLWNFTGLTDWFFVVALLHGLLAAVGFYLWLRALEVSPLAATLCALSFGGSAYMAFDWGFPTHLASLAWVPWIFWASKRLSEKTSLAWWSLTALFWAFQILAGYPFFTFYAGLFLWICIRWKFKADLKTRLAHASAFLAALGLTSCQWLPFADYLGCLHREGWGDNLFSLRWINFLTLLQPDLLGIPGMADYRGDYPSFIFDNLYLGLVPLGLFLWSFFSAKTKDSFWGRSALLWLLWLAGVHFAVWRVLPNGLLDKLEPAKASFVFLFCALTAVAVSLEEKIRSTPRKNKIRVWAWALGFLWMVDLLWIPARVVHTVPDPYRAPEVQQAALTARQMAGEGRIASLRHPGPRYSPEVNDPAGSMREMAMEIVPNTNVVWGLKSARGYLTIFPDGFQNLDKYLQWGAPYDGRVLDAAGTSLVIFQAALPSFKYYIHQKVGNTIFTRNAGAMGHVWLTERVREFPDRPSVFEALLNPKAFLENEVYTEKAPDGKAVLLPPASRHLPGSSSPSLLQRLTDWGRGAFQKSPSLEENRHSPCEAQLMISAPRGGYLVFDESYAPGWHAWVDGQPEPIFRAYGLWMAVLIKETGNHQVFFRYEPASFRLGLFISLFSGAVMILGLALNRRRLYQEGWIKREKP
jgi:hypothetical protein